MQAQSHVFARAHVLPPCVCVMCHPLPSCYTPCHAAPVLLGMQHYSCVDACAVPTRSDRTTTMQTRTWPSFSTWSCIVCTTCAQALAASSLANYHLNARLAKTSEATLPHVRFSARRGALQCLVERCRFTRAIASAVTHPCHRAARPHPAWPHAVASFNLELSSLWYL